ncbi:restriction endonuclease subunit S [Kushneria sp. TE3]|uniref:restriction endonuclease subunit S n=1 Tax=Kushneria sp. TE3 TaxID=3449832 RepID=UPI003F68233E
MKFNEYSLKDLLSHIVDNRGRSCPTAEKGIPLIATNCIKNTGLYPVYEKVRYVSEETYQNWFRGHPKPGDMIFVCKGSPGRVCWVPNPVPFCIAQDMVAIRADESKVHPKYLFALLRSDEVQNKILNMHVGTLIPHFKKGDFSNLYLLIPEDFEYQRKVGEAYFSFCEKIENNHQINQTLEQMAQALFKSWFVDFDPVKAKIAARERWQAIQPGNESASLVCYAAEFDEPSAVDDLETTINRAAMQAISGKTAEQLDALRAEDPERYQELYETAALFPSAMQASELGEIPEGWTHGCLADIATYENERVQSEKLSIEDYVSTENMLENKKGICEASSIPSSATVPSFSPSEILVSNIRPYFKKIWLANKFGGRSPDVLGIKSISVESSEFVYNLLYRDQFFDYMMLTSKGVKMPRGDKKAIMEFQCSLPTTELIECFSAKVREFYLLVDCRNQESKRLSSIRDTLLPKLLSGELTPSEAEEAHPEATA